MAVNRQAIPVWHLGMRGQQQSQWWAHTKHALSSACRCRQLLHMLSGVHSDMLAPALGA